MDSMILVNQAINYIESNLTNEIRYSEISRITLSPLPAFQRFFALTTGITLSEYIRRRRLSCAAYDLQNTDCKVIDIAYKYSYESSDAFSVAFKRAYGITPSAARQSGIELEPFYRLYFEISVKYMKGDEAEKAIKFVANGNEIVKYENGGMKMPEIIKTYRQSVPALRFIGKKYGDNDRINGMFGVKWGEWFQNGWFKELEQITPKAAYEEADASIGLMRYKESEPFEYWIGIFFPENTPVPDGFTYKDFPASDLGVAWLYGNESNVYKHEGECAESCEKEGYSILADEQSAYWFFERYASTRFCTPDEKGNIILDICHYIKKAE